MSAETAFGLWLKQRRKDLGISREELVERIDCSLATLQKIESGARRPSRQIALLLADYFGIPRDEHEAFTVFARGGSAPGLGANSVSVSNSRAPWRAAHLERTNLPATLTSFIGREREVAEVSSLLLQPKVRLLTVTGAPGIGKTRLAIEVASSLMGLGEFEDGAFLVELSTITEPELVLASAAQTLGLKEVPNEAVETQLLRHVRERRMLLVLDNFEQVLDAAPGVVKLLEGSPWLKALVTSREALHIRGERLFVVPPLPVPEVGKTAPKSTLLAYESVELFVERALSAAPEFVVTAENISDVSDVCAGLDGLPLAIELAAAQVGRLSPQDIRVGLKDRLELLQGGARDLDLRHRTLRDTIAWSYGLLNEDEQRLFRRLGVFIGGCALAEAESVCNYDGQLHIPVGEGLALLVRKSLLRRREDGRFVMLETIRQYARGLLLGGGKPGTGGETKREAQGVMREHALCFMKLAEEAEPHLVGTEQVEWLDRLENEHDNLRAALYWAGERCKGKARGDTGSKGGSDKDAGAEAAELGLRLAAALPRFWYKRGHLREGMELLGAALDGQYKRWNTEPLPPGQAGVSSPVQRVPNLARPHVGKALLSAGILAHLRGDYASARALCEESLAIRRELDDKRGVAAVLAQLGTLEGEQGNRKAARALAEQCLAIYREIDDRAGISRALNNLAAEAYEAGDHATSRSLLQESLAIRREMGDKRGIASTLGNLGVLAWEEKDYASACALYEETLAIWSELGDEAGTAYVLGQLGTIAYEKGDHPSAGALQRESLGIRWKLGSTIHIPNNLAGLGRLAATNEDPRQVYRGAQLLGTTSALWASMGVEPERAQRREYDDGITACTARLGEAVFTAAWNEGRDMSLEQAIAFALESAVGD